MGFPVEQVSVICCDGKNIIGKLQGLDKLQNLILVDAHERIFSTDADVEREALGECRTGLYCVCPDR